MENMKENFLKKKSVTIIFAFIALFSGFLFLNQSMTGNAILNRQSSVNLVSLIGLLLVFCSVILFAYSVKKK